MWRNGIYVYETRPGMLDYIGKGIGKSVSILLIFSPYLFIPYLIYRWIDPKPEPFFWIAGITVIGAFGVWCMIRYVFNRLRQWKDAGVGFKATATLYFFQAGFLVLRIWSVQAGFALLMRNYHESVTLSEIFAALYVLFLIIGYFKRKFPTL